MQWRIIVKIYQLVGEQKCPEWTWRVISGSLRPTQYDTVR